MAQNKSLKKRVVNEERKIDEKDKTEKEEWEKPIVYEGDVALYCMGEG